MLMTVVTDSMVLRLWIAKGILWAFYSDIVDRMYNGPVVLRIAIGILIVTYIASILASLFECHPLYLYWQVLPDPGMNRCPV